MGYDTLVLPGGGIKGFHLLGAVQALIDSNLTGDLKNYIGTSVGAILSYFFAIGYTPIEIIVSLYMNRFLEKMKYFDLVSMINGNGAIGFTSISEAIEKMTIDKIGCLLTLGKLRELFGKNLICVTYNMTSCKTEYLGPDNYPDLPCVTALRMSCNIPLVFERFKYMDSFYVDGGLSDNFAINKGKEIGIEVLGLNLQISESSLRDDPNDGLVSYFVRLLQIPIIQSTAYRIQSLGSKCTIIPIQTGELKNIIEFDVKSKTRLEMFSAGYNEVKKFFSKR